jgi:hypothetical protein
MARVARQALDRQVGPAEGVVHQQPSPSSRTSPAKIRRASPEFAPPAPAGRPRGHIAKENFFSRVFLQSDNSNSKVIFLFLVNCVEN